MTDDFGKIPPANPEIRVIFKGFVVSQIRQNADSAWVGALDASVSTCHRPKIFYYKITPAEPGSKPPNDGKVELICPKVDLTNHFSIKITPTPKPGGIRMFHFQPEPFERLDETDNHKQDFRWFVDLDKVHPRPIRFITEKIMPMFFFQRGEFHTSLRSDGDARIGPAFPKDSETRRFGKFASEITARITLKETETASLYNGDTEVISGIKKGEYRYDIVFDCACNARDDELLSDFELIYQVIDADPPLKDWEKIKFEHEKHAEDFNPEVYCMGGNGGGG